MLQKQFEEKKKRVEDICANGSSLMTQINEIYNNPLDNNDSVNNVVAIEPQRRLQQSQMKLKIYEAQAANRTTLPPIHLPDISPRDIEKQEEEQFVNAPIDITYEEDERLNDPSQIEENHNNGLLPNISHSPANKDRRRVLHEMMSTPPSMTRISPAVQKADSYFDRRSMSHVEPGSNVPQRYRGALDIRSQGQKV